MRHPSLLKPLGFSISAGVVAVMFPGCGEQVGDESTGDAPVVPCLTDQLVDLVLRRWIFLRETIPIRSRSESVHGFVQGRKQIRKRHANGFEAENIHQGDLAVEVSHGTGNRGGIATNVPDAPYEGPDNVVKHVGPAFLVKWAGIFDPGKRVVDRLSKLADHHLFRNLGEIDSPL